VRTWHRAEALALLASLVALGVWALVARLRRRAPGRAFLPAAVVVAVVALVQVGVGVALLAGGGRRPPLHYLYGALVAPALVLGAAVGRALRRDRWVPVAWAAVVAALLALRAFATGVR
jgi:hypothetical protein